MRNKILLLITAFFLVLFAFPFQSLAAKGIAVRLDKQSDQYLLQGDDGWYLNISGESQSAPHYLEFDSDSYKDGFYWFDEEGRWVQEKGFHEAHCKVAGRKFDGIYYFGYDNGRLYTRKRSGQITRSGKKYYIYRTARAITSAWKNGHYYTESGELAVCMQTPDGYYVDSKGKKCSKNTMVLSPLRDQLKDYLKHKKGTWSIYIKDLKTDDIVKINNKSMYPASVIKLFAMACVYDRIKHGQIKNNTSVKRYLRNMITVSDNDSFNKLVLMCGKGSWKNGCKVLNKYIKSIGCKKTSVHNSMYPAAMSRISDNGALNRSCAEDAAHILDLIYKGKLVSKSYSKQMLNLLLKQRRRYKIPAGLPSGIKSANKTGEKDPYNHDTAIVYGKKTRYETCIFTKGGSTAGIQTISAMVYDYLNQ